MDLSVEPGIFGFIGPNGAGKTTLVRVLLGLIKPTNGHASVLGYNVVSDSLQIRKRVGVLLERPSYPKSMKVLDYLKFVMKMYRRPSDAKYLLNLVDLLDAKDRKIGELSAGMHQRLGIAQALVGEPELIILDEPTSNLDVIGREDVLNLITDLHQEAGISFFIASHILSELERICHSAAFVYEGRILDKGSVTDLIKRHTSTRLKVKTPFPKKLCNELEQIDEISKASQTGTNTVTVTVNIQHLDHIKAVIRTTGNRLGIEILGFESAQTLEDAFREAIVNE